MHIVGLVGPMGAGKSIVAEVFSGRGAEILRADDASRELLSEETCLLFAVRQELGDAIFGEDGQLDRKKTAELIFEDVDARRRLEAIMHPRMIEWLAERLAELRTSQNPPQMVVIEAAILTHMGARHLVDAVVRVSAPEDVCVQRVMARDGISRQEASRRIAVHKKLGLFEEPADYILDTSGSVEQTQVRAKKLAHRILRESRAGEQTGSTDS